MDFVVSLYDFVVEAESESDARIKAEEMINSKEFNVRIEYIEEL